MDLSREELIQRLKWLGYAIAALGILVYFYADDLSKIVGFGKVAANGD